MDINGISHYKQGSPDDIQYWDDFRYRMTNGFYQFVYLCTDIQRVPVCVSDVLDAYIKLVGDKSRVHIKYLHPSFSDINSHPVALVSVSINKEFIVAETILKTMNSKLAKQVGEKTLKELAANIDECDGIILVAKTTREEILMRMLMQVGVDITSAFSDPEYEEGEC